MRNLFFSFSLLLALPVLGKESHSFRYALEMSYENSYELRERVKYMESAETNRTLQSLYFIPSLKVGVDLKNQEKIGQDDVKFMTGFEGSKYVALESMIFRSGQVFAVSLAEKELQLSFLTLKLTKEKIFFDILTAYAGILTQEQAVDLSRSNLELIKKERDTLAMQKDAGMASVQDVLLSEAYVNRAEVQLSSARSLLTEHRIDYQDLVGYLPERLDSSIDTLAPQYLFPDFFVQDSLEESIIAFEENDKSYQIVYLKNAIEMDRAKEIAFRDDITVTGGIYGTKLITDKTMPESHKSSYNITFRAGIKLPLLLPLVMDGVDSFIQSRESNVLHSRTELRQNFEIAWEKLSEQKSQIKYLEKLVSSQELYVKALQEMVSAGIESSKDYLRGSNELLKARINLLKAKTSHLFNLYKIIFSVNSIQL